MKSAKEMVVEAIGQIETVSQQEAAEEKASGGVVFLDVREPTEWEAHIKGAVQVPRGILESAADPTSPAHRPELDPAGRVIVYCRSGARAALATLTLKTMGYGNVANLGGGINAWKEAGLPVSEHHADI
jgi:rhodanese-related sulfurtransferase